MNKIFLVIIICISLFSCISQKETIKKEPSYFALEDHTFEETCAYFDSCYKAYHHVDNIILK